MPNEDNKILKYNYWKKSLKALLMIYADLECLLKKMHSCQNNLEKFYREKKLIIHLLVIRCLQIIHLTQQKTNFIVTEEKTVWKSFVKTWEHAMKIINYEKKEMILLTNEENEYH